MLVREWMSSPVHVVKPLDSAKHARELLEQHRINQLPVVAKGKLVGIVTDRDLRDAFPSVLDEAAGSRRGRGKADPATITVESIMSSNVLTIAPDEPMATAVRKIRDQRVGALPVVEDGKIVGILARSDVLEAFAIVAERLHALESAPHEVEQPAHASDEIRRNW